MFRNIKQNNAILKDNPNNNMNDAAMQVPRNNYKV